MRNAGFSYDASGNLSSIGTGTAFTYDPESFMATLSSSGTTATYKVDAQGRRVLKTVHGVTTDYFYSSSEVVSEKQGSSWTDYIFFGSQRIAKQTGSTASTATYLHVDHLGSTRVCTNSSGDSAGTCDYEPFGEVQPGTTCSVPVNYRFAGMEWDSELGGQGLYHTWFRQYDPTQGRWLSVDPLPGDPDAPQSLDRYAYVINDPLNLTDPFGLEHDCAFYIWIVLPDDTGYWRGLFCGQSSGGGNSGCAPSFFGGAQSSNCPGDPQQPTPQPPQQEQPKPEKPLHCHPKFIEASSKAWQRAGIGTLNTEAGFEVRGSTVVPTFIRLPNTNEFRKITFPIQENTVAIFHTHSNPGSGPSQADRDVRRPVTGSLVPVYVGSIRGLYITDARAKEGYLKLREGLDWLKPCP